MLVIGILLLAAAVYAVSVASGVVGVRTPSVRRRVAALVPAQVEDAEPGVRVESQRPGLAVAVTPPILVRAIERNLVLGGHPDGWSVERTLLAKPLCAVVGVLFAAALWSHVAGVLRIVLVGLVVLTYFVPDLLVKNYAIKRQDEIQRALADTLDQVTISIEAGLGFEAALGKAGQTGTGALADELVRLLQDMNLGMSRRDAYEALAGRTSVDDLRRFARAIVQAEEHGVPIASVVRTQAREMRIARRARAEEKAQKVPVKVLLPLMTLILPVLFVIVLGPAVYSAYHHG